MNTQILISTLTWSLGRKYWQREGRTEGLKGKFAIWLLDTSGPFGSENKKYPTCHILSWHCVDYGCIREYILKSNFIGRVWLSSIITVLSPIVGAILGTSPKERRIYGISNNGRGYVMSGDSGKSWVSIPRAVYKQAASRRSFVKAKRGKVRSNTTGFWRAEYFQETETFVVVLQINSLEVALSYMKFMANI